MITTRNKMTLSHFHDFYFLQALQAAIMSEIARDPSQQFRRSVESLQMDVQETFDEMIPNMAKRVFVYLYAACLGEARHSRSNYARERFVPEVLKSHRMDCFANVTRYEPTHQNLNALVLIFSQDWKSGFGGNAWKQIALALLDYGRIPDAAWLDHVVDLEHNNGTAFNKQDSSNTVEFDCNYPSSFRDFLNYKFAEDILKSPRLDRYEEIARMGVTRRVHKLIRRLEIIFGGKNVHWALPINEWLSDYEVKWGTGTLHVQEKCLIWSDVTDGNELTVDKLATATEITDVYAPNWTRQELKKELTKKANSAKKIGGKFMTATLFKEFKKYAMNLYNDQKSLCKLAKAKVTYEVLPALVDVKSATLYIFIALPFQGYGNKVDGGFVVTAPIPMFTSPKSGNGYINQDYGGIYLHVGESTIQLNNKELEALLD